MDQAIAKDHRNLKASPAWAGALTASVVPRSVRAGRLDNPLLDVLAAKPNNALY